jgi:hypothetical protein
MPTQPSDPTPPPDLSPEADDRPQAIPRLMLQLEQAVDEIDAVLEAGADLLPATAADPAARRELARQIAIGALLNRDNPEWDPADPATHRPIPDDPVLAMLEGWSADIEAAAALEPAAP